MLNCECADERERDLHMLCLPLLLLYDYSTTILETTRYLVRDTYYHGHSCAPRRKSAPQHGSRAGLCVCVRVCLVCVCIWIFVIINHCIINILLSSTGSSSSFQPQPARGRALAPYAHVDRIPPSLRGTRTPWYLWRLTPKPI